MIAMSVNAVFPVSFVCVCVSILHTSHPFECDLIEYEKQKLDGFLSFSLALSLSVP